MDLQVTEQLGYLLTNETHDSKVTRIDEMVNHLKPTTHYSPVQYVKLQCYLQKISHDLITFFYNIHV